MNNKYFASPYYALRASKGILFCITVLALAPACCKRQEPSSAKATKGTKAVAKKDVNTMIELDNSVFETENNDDTQKSIVKF